MRNFTKYIVFIGIFILGLIIKSDAQPSNNRELKITNVEYHEKNKAVLVEFVAKENNVFPNLESGDVEIKEKTGTGNWESMTIERIDNIEILRSTIIRTKKIAKEEKLSIVFLIDRTLSMNQKNAFSEAKKAIKSVVKNEKLPSNTAIYSSYLDDISISQPLDINNVDLLLDGVTNEKKNRALHKGVITKINSYKNIEGKKILIVITHGKNNAKDESSPSIGEIENIVSSLDSNFLIFPIGLGTNLNINFLENLSAKSPSQEDYYIPTTAPNKLTEYFTNIIADMRPKNGILVTSVNPNFKGNERTISIKWKDKEFESTYRVGTLADQKDTDEAAAKNDIVDWGSLLFLGLNIILGIYILIGIILPKWEKRNFKRKYIKAFKEVKHKYIKSFEETQVSGAFKIKQQESKLFDPIRETEIKDEDVVVAKCKKPILLETWESCKNKCPHYPSCVGTGVDKCQNGDGVEPKGFVFRSKDYKKFIWTWFGAIGGMIGWVVWVIFKEMNTITHKNWWLGMVEKGEAFFESLHLNVDSIKNNIGALSNDTLEGLAIGIGLGFALTYVEELGQSRKRSWSRILTRTLAIGIISYIIFAFGFFLEQASKFAFIGAGIKTLLFGAILGSVLAIKSTIPIKRGIAGGILASILGFIIYFLIARESFNYAKLVSFLILGGILGYIIVSVVSRVENIQLEYLEPKKYQGINPISKWLKKGISVDIGTNPDSYVYIRWSDKVVKPKHATLNFNGQKVTILPLGEVLVNDRIIPINQPAILKNNDIIRLGIKSVTKIRYVETLEEREIGGFYENERLQRNQYPSTGNSKKLPKPTIRIKRRN